MDMRTKNRVVAIVIAAIAIAIYVYSMFRVAAYTPGQ